MWREGFVGAIKYFVNNTTKFLVAVTNRLVTTTKNLVAKKKMDLGIHGEFSVRFIENMQRREGDSYRGNLR